MLNFSITINTINASYTIFKYTTILKIHIGYYYIIIYKKLKKKSIYEKFIIKIEPFYHMH